ncbi:hypothetical protein BDZ91DRAFT_773034 [Kalaharituber pfeilii]|nr:hypothetical protein BDZ91DRAFT_773034 [Kalaharituber pfeilii]
MPVRFPHFESASTLPHTLVIYGTFIDAPTPHELRVRLKHVCVVDVRCGRITTLCPEEEFVDAVDGVLEGVEVVRMRRTQAVGVGLVDCLGTKTDVPLMEWLNKYTFPEESSFRNDAHSCNTYSSLLRRLLRNGTTTAVYFATNHLSSAKILAETAAAYGQRAYVGKVCSDQLVPEYYSVADTEEFIKWVKERWDIPVEGSGYNYTGPKRRGGREALIKAVITPRFGPTCSWELLCELGKLARKYDVFVQSHAAESVDEVMLVADMHPNMKRDIKIFSESGLLTDKSILAHCCHLSEAEVSDIVSAKAGIVSCPHSNMLFARAVVDIPHYYCPPSSAVSGTTTPNATNLSLGVRKIGLGTDIAGGPSSSLWHNMRLAIIQDRIPSFRNFAGYPDDVPNNSGIETASVWRMTHTYTYHIATVGGAATVGMEELLGVLEVMRLFDAVLVDWGMEDQGFEVARSGGEESSGEERFMMGGDDRNVLKVWVDGKEVCRRI